MGTKSGDHKDKASPDRAAAYVRMSTEHQQYSISNQMDIIRNYARSMGLKIVREYSDGARSGMIMKGRAALAELIEDVKSGNATFQHILVYDVSRWGRFMDTDEGGHYEFLCRQAGARIHYCVDQLENDGSSQASMIISMKRWMAGDYSRTLSEKVFQGACRLIRLGFRQGGAAGYGLRRMLVDHMGMEKGVLSSGEHKSIQTDRIVLVPGPDDEVANVRWMFRVFVNKGWSERQITSDFNARGILTDLGRPWTRGTVHQVLTNEKYIGNNVYHRTSFKLKQQHVKNPPDDWIRAESAWPSLVEPEMFLRAREIILERSKRLTNEEMLGKLKELLGLRGELSGILIDEQEGLPSSSAFRSRFGSLVNAYTLIGYTPATDYSFIEENKAIRRMHPEIMAETVQQLEQIGATVEADPRTKLLHVNGEFSVSIVLCRHTTTRGGRSRWLIRFDTGLRPDLTIAVRMMPGNQTARDYYILPALDMTLDRLQVSEDNGVELDGYRFDDLSFFFRIAGRIQIEIRP